MAEIAYADRRIEKICTQQRTMNKELGADAAKQLRKRIAQLRAAESMRDLLLGPGRWETLTADRSGQWSARLSRNWRIIVVEEHGAPLTVTIQEFVDYH